MGGTPKKCSSKKLMATCNLSNAKPGSKEIYALEFDGASKGNPGRAGAGAILKRPDGSVLCELTKGVGVATCNFAEYEALIIGLQAALDRGIYHIKVQGDSKLVCSQIMGRWKVKSVNLSASFSKAMRLKQMFQSFSIQHVYRKFNTSADTLANAAINLPSEAKVMCSNHPDVHETVRTTSSLENSQSIRLRSNKVFDPDHQGNEKFHCMAYHGSLKGKHTGVGAVLYSPDGKLCFKINQRLCVATRNVAQYQALIIGLRAALEHKVSYIRIQGDALLVFKQITGIVKVNDEMLQALWKEANDLLSSFTEFHFMHVDKCQNIEARALADMAFQPQDKTVSGDSKNNSVLIKALSTSSLHKSHGCKISPYAYSDSAGSGVRSKLGEPVTLMRSPNTAVTCRRFSTAIRGLNSSCYNGNGCSIVPRWKAPQPSHYPLLMSNILASCLRPRLAFFSAAFQCASRRINLNPHVFQCSLMHKLALSN